MADTNVVVSSGLPASLLDVTFLTQTPSGDLNNEQALNALSDGLLKHSSGVVDLAAAGVDYLAPAAIGTTVQAWDADLDTWATKTPPSGVVIGTTDSQTLTNKTIDPASNTIDGDVLDITFTPSNYTPSTAPAEASDADDLAAHLQGIDDALASAGGASLFDATVGSSGADYTDVQAAIDGGAKRILLITDVTEDSAITNTGDTLLHLSNFTLTLGANYFAGSGEWTVVGNGINSGAELDYTHTVGVQLFESSSSIVLRDLLIDNNSTTSSTGLANNNAVYATNVKMELPDQSNSGFNGGTLKSFLNNIWIVGGGSSCTAAFSFTNGLFNNVYFSGQFSTGQVILISGDCVANNFSFDHDTNSMVAVLGGLSHNNFVVVGSQDLDVLAQTNGRSYSNFNLLGGDFDISFYDDLKISNLLTTGLLDLSDANSVNCKVTNSRWSTATTIAGDRHKLTNCDILGGVTINSGAVQNSLIGCQAGPDAGGGSLTITDNNTANDTIIVGCRTDAAIAGSGTPQTAANVVY